MFVKDINAKETSDQPLIMADVNRKPTETVAGVHTLESSAQRRMLHVLLPESRILSKGMSVKAKDEKCA